MRASAGRAARRRDAAASGADHRTSRRAAHAADDEGADRARARSATRPRSRSTARHGEDDAPRKAAHERAALLTPVAKAFSTDIGIEVASLGVQVHGGMGYIEETGAAQHLRDARIAAIYEGTNGIQAIDLVMRKLPLSGGDDGRAHIRMRGIVEAVRRATIQPSARPRCGSARRSRASIARRRGYSAGPHRATQRSPARRPICACSACHRRLPAGRRGARGVAPTTNHRRARRWRGSSPRTSRSRRRAGTHRGRRRAEHQRRRRGAGVM